MFRLIFLNSLSCKTVRCWFLTEDVLLSYVGSWPAAAAGVTVKVRSVQSTEYS